MHAPYNIPFLALAAQADSIFQIFNKKKKARELTGRKRVPNVVGVPVNPDILEHEALVPGGGKLLVDGPGHVSVSPTGDYTIRVYLSVHFRAEQLPSLVSGHIVICKRVAGTIDRNSGQLLVVTQ